MATEFGSKSRNLQIHRPIKPEAERTLVEYEGQTFGTLGWPASSQPHSRVNEPLALVVAIA